MTSAPRLRKGKMKARALIEGASFGPDALKVIAQAFDEAWKDVAGNFGEKPAVVEAAEVRLAKALLSVDPSRAYAEYQDF
jgi:hypothetical protein